MLFVPDTVVLALLIMSIRISTHYCLHTFRRYSNNQIRKNSISNRNYNSVNSFIDSYSNSYSNRYAYNYDSNRYIKNFRLFGTMNYMDNTIEEFLIFNSINADTNRILSQLQSQHQNINVLSSTDISDSSNLIWLARRGPVELDCMLLEEEFLGKRKLSDQETIDAWLTKINDRKSLLQHYRDSSSNSNTNQVQQNIERLKIGDGGKYQLELNAAVVATHHVSFITRSLQKHFVFNDSAVSKVDNSPVTVADFTAQAIIIDRLSKLFPDDVFIAEEDSQQLEEDSLITNKILDAIKAGINEDWNKEKLFTVINKGKYSGSSIGKRVWVLDPIDGTKGFVRGEHYCIALALMIDGLPVVSSMGCPNLNLRRVLQGESYDMKPYSYVDPLIKAKLLLQEENNAIESTDHQDLYFNSLDCGSIYFAVSGCGAFARSLTMPLSAAYEVTTSFISVPSEAKLCESAEAGHSDRSTTKQVAESMGVSKDFVRLDGQCKLCIVGAGAAEANLRLPPAGYREKIWDQVPGAHFITEAGGKVTDLNNKDLDFRNGRLLSSDVTGIVCSNGFLHKTVLDAIGSVLE